MNWLLIAAITGCIALSCGAGYLYNGQDEYEEEENASRAAGMFEYLFQQRGYPDPNNLNAKWMRAWQQELALREQTANIHLTRTTANSWQSIGPFTVGGRMLCMAVDPGNKNVIYAGSASGGIWKTTTGGVGVNAWTNLRTNLPVLGVSSILMHPTNNQILLAGTGEVYRVDPSGFVPGNIGFNVWKTRGSYGIGIIRSADGGATWTQVLSRNSNQLFAIQQLRFHPNNPSIVYAAATDGLYRSTDGGMNWSLLFSVTYARDVIIMSNGNTNYTDDTILLSVGNLSNTDKGIYRSIDNGVSFTKLTLPNQAAIQGYIALERVNATLAYASVGIGGTARELYRTTDGGANWTALSGSDHCGFQFWFAHDLAVNPGNSNQVMIGGVNLYNYNVSSSSKSLALNSSTSATTDVFLAPGSQEGSSTYVHPDIHEIQFLSNTEVLVACDGGIFYSADNGASWESRNGGLHTSQFFASVGQSRQDPNLFVGGLQDNNTVVYNGSRWKRVIGGDGGPAAVHPTNDNIVMASRDAREVSRSSNRTVSFSVRLSYLGFANDSRTSFMAPIAIAPSNPSIMYVGSDNLHSSTDVGVTFSRSAVSSLTRYVDAIRKPVNALTVSPTNANTVIAATSPFAQYDNDVNSVYVTGTPDLRRSTNASDENGYTFTSIKNGLPNQLITDIVYHPTNANVIYVTLGGFGANHIFKTTNGGSSWTAIDAGLPNVPFNAFAIEPSGNVIYAGSDLGAYVSTNDGVSWQSLSSGWQDATMVFDLVITPDNKLRAATHGKGVYEMSLFSLQVLPVQRLDISVQPQGSELEVLWQTQGEQQVKQFQVERSEDGNKFEAVYTQTARNNPSPQTYRFVDRNITAAKWYYYRIKLTDYAGTIRYSSIKKARIVIEESNVPVKLLSNPVRQSLAFSTHFAQSGMLQLQLYNAQAQTIWVKQMAVAAGAQQYQFPIPETTKGWHVLLMKNGLEQWRFQILIQ